MLRSALGALFWLGLFASARAQPALDAVTHSNTSNGGSTVTVSVTTSAANEIVLVAMADRISDASAAISGCTLTWHAGGLANGGRGSSLGVSLVGIGRNANINSLHGHHNAGLNVLF